jgi:HK97 family phage portal protein
MPNPHPLARPLALPWDNALRKAAALVVGRQRGGMTGGLTWGAPLWGAWRNTHNFDYRAAVGDPLDNSIVAACLRALAEAAPEPQPRVYRIEADGDDTPLPKHPAQSLLRRPNPFMSWELLMGYVVYATRLDGNAYLYKQRSAAGRVVELWPLYPGCVEPAWPENATTQEWITHYDYRPDGEVRDPLRLPREDVVHLRLNLDPRNMRKGRSALWSGFKHIFSDEEAAAFTGAMLRNFGVPGVILSPNPAAIAAAGGGPSEDDVQRQKTIYEQSFGGENRGRVMVTGAPFNVSVVSFSPEQMNLDKLQLMPEARVCALLGVPPIVAGLMVGMEHATYNNTGGLREHFTESTMVPFWRLLEGELTRSLVPDFGDPDELRIGFDLSDVRALQEDMDKKYDRVTKLLLAGGITLDTLHQELNLAPLPNGAGNVIYLPNTVTPTDPAELLAEPEPEPEPVAVIGQAPPPQLEDGTTPSPPTAGAEAGAADGG